MVLPRRAVRAVFAGKGLLPGVGADVRLQLFLLRGRVRAVGTGEGLFSRVGPNMGLEIGAMDSSEGAVRAGKGLLPRVSSHVELHVSPGRGGVPTAGAPQRGARRARDASHL